MEGWKFRDDHAHAGCGLSGLSGNQRGAERDSVKQRLASGWNTDQNIAVSTVVIIPALNEQESIDRVIASIPRWVKETIVVDNGSTDATTERARAAGATVIAEPRRGYGRACLTGCQAARNAGIVVFLDGDLSDYPERMEKLVRPIAEGRADFVLGSRRQGLRECGALLPQQQFGGWLACALIRLLWGYRYTDLGPFRAIRTDSLQCLRMDDENFGWTVQMQIRAVVAGLRIIEIPVDYRRRIGRSKISGTVRGVLGAGIKIFYTIGRELNHRPPADQWMIVDRVGFLQSIDVRGNVDSALIIPRSGISAVISTG